MTPDLLARIGHALYGPLYRSELARALGVSHRTVRRWIEGAYPIPPEREAEIVWLITERAGTLADLAAEMAAEKNSSGPKKAA